jgi:hypothetical protein
MIITCNDKYSVRDFFHNRPSRLRYAIAFEGLSAEFIKEYCEDRLNEWEKYIEEILGLAASCDEFNFDMLQTLVDELNRYGGSLIDTVEILNVKPVGGGQKTSWSIKVKDVNNPQDDWTVTSNEKLTTSPLIMISSERFGNEIDIQISIDRTKKKKPVSRRGRAISIEDSAEEPEYHYISLRSEHLFKVDPYTGTYLFKTEADGKEFMFQISEDARPRSSFGSYTFGSMDF